MNIHQKTALPPEGTNDILFSECRFKKEVEKKIMDCFSGYGYQELETPSFEYDSVFSEAEGIYRLVDRSGKVLALRPDMTMPIARVAATKLYENLPVRASYLGNVYRYEDTLKGGRQNEFTQAGIELLGETGVFYDAEVIAATIDALLSAGIDDFMVELGNVNFVRGLLSESHLDEALIEEINDLMTKKDTLSIEEKLSGVSLDENIKQIFIQLPTLFGDISLAEQMKASLPEQSCQALSDLQEIVKYLSCYGYEKYVTLDLGMNKNMDYYTGMIFKVFTRGVGFPVAGGGRYDKMISRFGKNIPATGSAIYINRLLDGMEIVIPQSDDFHYLSVKDNEEAIIQEAQKLRASGKKVIVNR